MAPYPEPYRRLPSMTLSPPPAISIENISFSYGGPKILENIELHIASGEFLALVGPNGGGKSTLLKLILGLLKPQQGRVRIQGLAPVKGRAAIGYVPQFARFESDFPVSVEQTVLLGRLGKTRWFGGYRKQDKRIAGQAMRETHIEDLASRQIGQLSGGQLQRVLIARALACEPDILLLDEPTANIDLRAEEDIFDLLRKLNERLTIVVVSHDIGFISQYVSRVACLNKTLLCHHTDALTGRTIEELYGTPVRAIHHHHSH